MVNRPRAIALALAIVALAAEGDARAQKFPFPTPGGYVAGHTTSVLTTADAKAVYDTWKQEYVLGDCGGGLLRVQFGDPANPSPWTVSEGMGYGMVLAAYFGDKATYDGLLAFAKKNTNGDGMLGWKVDCNGFAPAPDYGETQATDGDTDVGFSLVVAAAQWGAPYDADAKTFLTALKAHDFDTCPNGRVLPNNGFDHGCQGENSSYWMPGYYRVFAETTGDAAFWNKAADDVIAVWLEARNPTTGLVANEIKQDGSTNGPSVVDYNGCRIPWRAALDYLWYGTKDAGDVAGKIATWVDSVGEDNLGDGYNIDGTPNGNNWSRSECFTGGYATGAMTTTQALVDKQAAYFKSPIGVDNYYSESLRALYTLMLSGAMWRPGAPTGAGGSSSASTSSGASSGAGGSASASTSSGATSGAGGAAISSTSSSGGGKASDAPTQSKGCGCVVAGDRDDPSLLGLGAGLGLLVVAKGRRRRGSR